MLFQTIGLTWTDPTLHTLHLHAIHTSPSPPSPQSDTYFIDRPYNSGCHLLPCRALFLQNIPLMNLYKSMRCLARFSPQHCAAVSSLQPRGGKFYLRAPRNSFLACLRTDVPIGKSFRCNALILPRIGTGRGKGTGENEEGGQWTVRRLSWQASTISVSYGTQCLMPIDVSTSGEFVSMRSWIVYCSEAKQDYCAKFALSVSARGGPR